MPVCVWQAREGQWSLKGAGLLTPEEMQPRRCSFTLFGCGCFDYLFFLSSWGDAVGEHLLSWMMDERWCMEWCSLPSVREDDASSSIFDDDDDHIDDDASNFCCVDDGVHLSTMMWSTSIADQDDDEVKVLATVDDNNVGVLVTIYYFVTACLWCRRKRNISSVAGFLVCGFNGYFLDISSISIWWCLLVCVFFSGVVKLRISLEWSRRSLKSTILKPTIGAHQKNISILIWPSTRNHNSRKSYSTSVVPVTVSSENGPMPKAWYRSRMR